MGKIIHNGVDYHYTEDYFKYNDIKLLKENLKCTPDRSIKKIKITIRLEKIINFIKSWNIKKK